MPEEASTRGDTEVSPPVVSRPPPIPLPHKCRGPPTNG